MIKLPSDFKLERYGIRARLVCEDDAELITALRSDARLGRHIHANNGDVGAQKLWTREYKKREAEALDYYFIFFKDENPIVLCRIYNIDWVHLTYTSGSWVSVPGSDYESVMTCSVIMGEIAQDILGLLVDIYDVRKGNAHVLNYHRNILHALQYGETDLDYLFMSTPETRKNSKLKKLLRL